MQKKLREELKCKKLICDGAFGTYYAMKYDTKELINETETPCYITFMWNL